MSLQPACAVGQSPYPANVLIIAVGGLSECGKSTLCEALVERSNAKSRGTGAFRLKIGYLCDLASARLGRSFYDLDADRQATEFITELCGFLRWHRKLKVVTIDSLHNYEFTRFLVQMAAMRQLSIALRIVYIDTPLALRVKRTEDSGAVFDETKDTTKMSRGAHRIADLADLVVQNQTTVEGMATEVWTALDIDTRLAQ